MTACRRTRGNRHRFCEEITVAACNFGCIPSGALEKSRECPCLRQSIPDARHRWKCPAVAGKASRLFFSGRPQTCAEYSRLGIGLYCSVWVDRYCLSSGLRQRATRRRGKRHTGRVPGNRAIEQHRPGRPGFRQPEQRRLPGNRSLPPGKQPVCQRIYGASRHFGSR